MTWTMRLLIALAAMTFISSAIAEEMVACTPEHYYNSSETPPLLITIDKARGFANVLAKLFEISGQLPRIEATESVYK